MPSDKYCPYCGQPLPPPSPRYPRKRIYCSVQCRTNAGCLRFWRKHDPSRRPVARIQQQPVRWLLPPVGNAPPMELSAHVIENTRDGVLILHCGEVFQVQATELRYGTANRRWTHDAS